MNFSGVDPQRPIPHPAWTRTLNSLWIATCLSLLPGALLLSCTGAPQKYENPSQWSQELLKTSPLPIQSIWIEEGAILWQKPEEWGQDLWTLDSLKNRVDSAWLQSAPAPSWYWPDSLQSPHQDIRRPWKQGWLRLAWPLPGQSLGDSSPSTQNILIIHRLILASKTDLTQLLEGNSQDMQESEVDSVPMRKAVPAEIQTALTWTVWNSQQEQFIAYGTHFGTLPLPQGQKSLENSETWKTWWASLWMEVNR